MPHWHTASAPPRLDAQTLIWPDALSARCREREQVDRCRAIRAIPSGKALQGRSYAEPLPVDLDVPNVVPLTSLANVGLFPFEWYSPAWLPRAKRPWGSNFAAASDAGRAEPVVLLHRSLPGAL